MREQGDDEMYATFHLHQLFHLNILADVCRSVSCWMQTPGREAGRPMAGRESVPGVNSVAKTRQHESGHTSVRGG